MSTPDLWWPATVLAVVVWLAACAVTRAFQPVHHYLIGGVLAAALAEFTIMVVHAWT